MERFATPFPGRIHRLGELATDVWWSWSPDARALFRRLDLGDVAHHRAQPGADAADARRRVAAAGGRRRRVPAAVRRGHRRARRDPPVRQLVVAQPSRRPTTAAVDRLLLGRVRPAPVAADLRRRPRRAGRRPLQGGQRPRRAAGRHRLHVPAGLLPPARDQRRLAAGALRADQLGRRPDRNRHHARRQAVHHRGAARRSHGAGGGLAGPGRPRPPLPARHRPRRERAVGPRAVGPALRRRPRDPHPAGGHPRHRRRARAARDGHRAGRLAPQRGARRVRGAAADPRAHRAGRDRSTRPLALVRQTTVFTTHTPVPAGHDAFPFQLVEKHLAGCLGRARPAPGPLPGPGRVRQRARRRSST